MAKPHTLEPMNHRPERVGSLIREELAKLIARELEFGGALVTLTDVEIDKKLDTAKVGVTVFPSDKGEESLKILRQAQGELQWQLLRKINIKPMPHIYFFLDYGPENAARVEKALLDDPSTDSGQAPSTSLKQADKID